MSRIRSRRSNWAARAMFQALEPRRMFSAGDLDLSFSSDGKNVVDLPGVTNEFVNATLVMNDGKILVAGRATGAETDFLVARLLPSGNLDTSFGGGDGFTTIDFANTDEAMDIAVQINGNIVVVGTSSTGTGSNARDFAIARLNAGGVLDTTFDSDGRATVDFGANDDAMAVAIDGTAIYVGGYKDLGATGHFALAKLTTLGNPDTSYSTDGEVFFGFGGNNDSRCYDIILDESHRVVMVGYDEVIGGGQGRNFAYARVGTNAVLDPAFSGDGLAVTDFASGDDEARAVGINRRGNIVVGGFSDGTNGDDFTATRLSSAGALDSSFNGDGVFTLNVGGVEAVDDLVIHPDGDITLTGQTGASGIQAAVVRISGGSGNLSTTFGDGGDGIQLINFGAFDDGFACAIDPRDNHVVIAGTDGSGKLAIGRVHDLIDSNFDNSVNAAREMVRLPDGKLLVRSANTLRRLLPDGSLDPTFLTANVGSLSDFAVDSLGRIATVFTINDFSHQALIRTRRFLANGATDTSFSGDGVFDVSFDPGSGRGSKAGVVAVDSSNRIVVGGILMFPPPAITNFGDSSVARLTTSGALDTTFDGDGINVLSVTDATDDVNDIAIQANGQIVIAGEAGADRALVVRVNSNGNLDLGFGAFGFQRFHAGGVLDSTEANCIDFDSSGRIVVGGHTLQNGADHIQPFVARLTTGGSLDDNFDDDGTFILGLSADASERIDDIVVDSAGRIVTGGSVEKDEEARSVVRRLIPGAAVVGDATFAGDGVWVDPQPADYSFFGKSTSVLVDGAIYVGGGNNSITRLNVEPVVTDFEFLFETAPQRLRVRFNDDVGDSLTDFDLVIRNTTTNLPLNVGTYPLASYDHSTNTATFNFNGILADGNYTVTFSNTGIENKQGMNLAGDLVKDFFFLAGDANHDGRVNVNDFTILASNFGQSNRTFSQGNFNYDGVVNVNDFTILASRFGTALASDGSISNTGERLGAIRSPIGSSATKKAQDDAERLTGIVV